MASVYTFTPTNNQQQNSFSSPVLNPNEVFHHAGWNTPSIKVNDDNGLYTFSPFPFDFSKTQEPSEDIRQRLSKSREDFARSIQARAEYENKLKELATGDCDSTELITETELIPLGSTLDDMKTVASSLEIPKSYEEIYSISVRNRGQRNKEKKRVRDSSDNPLVGNCVLGDGLQGDVSSDSSKKKSGLADSYFVDCDQKVNCDLANTLDFAKEVGWLQSAEQSRAVEEAFLRDEMLSSATEETNCNLASTSSLRKSGDKPKMFGTNGGTSNNPRTASKTINSDSSNKSQAHAGAKFDYAKFSQSGSIGALHTKVDQKAAPERSKNSTINSTNNKNNKVQPFRVRQEVVNPYLFNSKMDDKI